MYSPGAVKQDETKKTAHPLLWVTTNYIAMGIPFSMVIWVAAKMFKSLGHDDGEITVATASIGIAWSLKPLWAGFLDMFKTKKFFVLSMEFVMGALFVLMGLALTLPGYFGIIIAIMWVVAFASATQDICSDGIYISALDKKQQAAFIGVQGMAWNLGRVIAVSLISWLAGYMIDDMGMTPKVAWMNALFFSGALMVVFGLWHMPMLPTGSVPEEKKGQSAGDIVRDFLHSAADFCNKRALWGMLAFVFFYRSGEGLLLVEAPLFMQGCMEDGALQMSLQQIGVIDGAVSTVVSIVGGLLGGAFIAKFTLRRSLFILALCVNVPNLCYVYLSHSVSPENPMSFGLIAFVVSMEKFWYGFGFVGNMLYMMQQIAPGRFKMTHYAFATAFMNLVLVPTQMVSGPLAMSLGFKEYFWFVMFACIPSIVAAWFAPFPQQAAPDEETSVDDPSLLTEDEKKMQEASKWGNIYALLAIAAFLFIDVLALGFLDGAKYGAVAAGLLALMGLTTLLKLYLSSRAIAAGRGALGLSRSLQNVGAYLSNAKGAMVGGFIMIAITLIHAGWCVNKVNSIDWDCAFSENAESCLQPDAKPPTQCERKTIER